ncbi:MAG: hypothetical protein QXU18_12265 [Thermoplasmatales archaeon]
MKEKQYNKYKTIKEAAVAMKSMLEYHKATPERDGWYSFRDEEMNRDNPIYETFVGMMAYVKTDVDSMFKFSMKALNNIINSQSVNANNFRDEINEWLQTDADIYISDLTNWLNENQDNIEFLTQTLKEYKVEDGFDALQIAQRMAIKEVYDRVIDVLEELLDKDSNKDSEKE